MKKLIILVLFIQSVSCEKFSFLSHSNSISSNCADSSICHIVVKGSPDSSLISTSDMDTIRSLFDANRLNLDNLFFTWFRKDEINHFHVGCNQYINSLNVFTGELIFHFDSLGNYTGLSGEIIPEIKTKPIHSLCIGHVIELFLHNVEKDNVYRLQKIKEGCLRCELGYWDLNLEKNNMATNFTVAWWVKPIDSNYPFAYIDDTNDSLIFYNNGIYTF